MMKPLLGQERGQLPNLADVDRRLALAFGALIFFLMIVVLLAGGLYLRGVMEREQDRLSTLTTHVLASAVSRISFSGKYHARLLLEEIKETQPGILYLRVVDSTGRMLANSDPAGNDEMVGAEALAGVRAVLDGSVGQVVREFDMAGMPVREVSLAYRGGYDNAVTGVLQVGISELDRQRALKHGIFYMALLVVGLLALGIYLTLRISAHFGSPVRQVALALDRERTHLRTLVSTIPDLVWLKDTEGVYLACNAAFERFFGSREAEIIGKTDYDFVDAELATFFRQNDKEAMAAERPRVNEEWITFAADGHRALLETTKTPLRATDGSLIGVLGIGHDITESRRIQEELTRHRDHLEEVVQLRTAELTEAKLAAEAANRAKSIFLANMSHELRTPLNAILGFSQLMERDTGLPEDKRANLRTINKSGQHLLSLINDVLEISKIEAGRLHVQAVVVDLKGMVTSLAESISLRARNNESTLSVELAAEVPDHIECDIAKLRQILLNLLSNAVKFTRGGSITLSARVVERHDPVVTLEFAIRDTGVGMSAEELRQIFSSFYQAEAGIRQGEGTGLGLAISREYARLLGGEITAESQPGRGSTFRLRLPVRIASVVPVQPSLEKVTALSAGQPRYRILVAEDDPASRELLLMWLEDVGFSVRAVANGKAAIELFQAWQPHFIWMDMRMPVMDGFAATRAIRALPEGRTLPIVAFTASAFDEDRQSILAAGCDDVMTKPLQEEQMFGLMARYLGVKYDYREPSGVSAPPSPADLGALPEDARARLLSAAIRLDAVELRGIARELHPEYAAVAEYLESLVDVYRFDSIAEALKAKQPAALSNPIP